MSSQSAHLKRQRKKLPTSISQPSTSAASISQPSSEDINASCLVNDCILYILAEQRKNEVIKMFTLKNTVLGRAKKLFNMVISKVKEELKKTYGLKLVKVSRGYIVISNIPAHPNFARLLDYDGDELISQSLLLTILAVILMNKGSMRETEMWEFLKTLKVIEGASDISPRFGNVSNLLKKKFVSEMYLTYTAIPNDNNKDMKKVYEFRWGDRANAAVSRRKVMEFVAETYKTKIEDWTEQYEELRTYEERHVESGEEDDTDGDE